MRELDRLLDTLEASSPERRYHSAVGKVVATTSFDPGSDAAGFALLHLLSQGRLVTDEIDTDTAPVGGSVEENAHLVAHLFHAAGQPATWWKSCYPERIADPEVRAEVSWWLRVLSAHPEVRAVEAP